MRDHWIDWHVACAQDSNLFRAVDGDKVGPYYTTRSVTGEIDALCMTRTDALHFLVRIAGMSDYAALSRLDEADRWAASWDPDCRWSLVDAPASKTTTDVDGR